jgi:hypothetical protein
VKDVVAPSPKTCEVDGDMVTEVSAGGAFVIEMVLHAGPLVVPEYVPFTQIERFPRVLPAVKVTGVPVALLNDPSAELERLQLNVVDEVKELPVLLVAVALKVEVPEGATPTGPVGEIATLASVTGALVTVTAEVAPLVTVLYVAFT